MKFIKKYGYIRLVIGCIFLLPIALKSREPEIAFLQNRTDQKVFCRVLSLKGVWTDDLMALAPGWARPDLSVSAKSLICVTPVREELEGSPLAYTGSFYVVAAGFKGNLIIVKDEDTGQLYVEDEFIHEHKWDKQLHFMRLRLTQYMNSDDQYLRNVREHGDFLSKWIARSGVPGDFSEIMLAAENMEKGLLNFGEMLAYAKGLFSTEGDGSGDRVSDFLARLSWGNLYTEVQQLIAANKCEPWQLLPFFYELEKARCKPLQERIGRLHQ